MRDKHMFNLLLRGGLSPAEQKNLGDGDELQKGHHGEMEGGLEIFRIMDQIAQEPSCTVSHFVYGKYLEGRQMEVGE